jgi:hypothetical protein
MVSLISHTVLNPFLSGAALYALTRSPPEIKQHALSALAAVPFNIPHATAVSVLKALFGLGVVSYVNGLLNRWAFNHWSFSNGAAPWKWNEELCVMTGGSGGLGVIVTGHLIKKGIRVAILDISPPPQELLDSKSSENAIRTAQDVRIAER